MSAHLRRYTSATIAAAETAIGFREDGHPSLEETRASVNKTGFIASKIYAGAKNLVNVLSLRSILEELGFPQRKVFENGTPLLEDNRGAICAQKNPINKNLRHLNRRAHRIRQAVDDKSIDPVAVSTKHMLADILTKNLPDHQFVSARDLILGETDQPIPGVPERIRVVLGG